MKTKEEELKDDFRIDILRRIISILKRDKDVRSELITKSYLDYLQEKINFYNIGVQKGKLEQKKEELEWVNDKYDLFDDLYCEHEKIWRDRVKQLQKEISSDYKTRETPIGVSEEGK